MSKEKPQLQDQEFQLLLAWLAPDLDPDRRAQVYVDFHKRLTRLFVTRNCCSPEDLAYQALDRVARQLADGKQISSVERLSYLHGVAKFMALEHWRTCADCRLRIDSSDDDGSKKLIDLPSPVTSKRDAQEDEQTTRMLEYLDNCLNELSSEERLLLLEFYSEDKTAKIVTRSQMAARLGVTSGALRQRIWKLRTRVRNCVVKRVAE